MQEYTRIEQIITIHGIKFVCETTLENNDLEFIKSSWTFNEGVVKSFLHELHEFGIYLYLLEEVEVLKI